MDEYRVRETWRMNKGERPYWCEATNEKTRREKKQKTVNKIRMSAGYLNATSHPEKAKNAAVILLWYTAVKMTNVNLGVNPWKKRQESNIVHTQRRGYVCDGFVFELIWLLLHLFFSCYWCDSSRILISIYFCHCGPSAVEISLFFPPPIVIVQYSSELLKSPR